MSLNSHNENTLNSHNETTLNSHNNNIFNHMEYPSRERRIASDADGLEADAIIHLNDGRWGAIEVKLGSHGIDAGARNLIRLAHKVDTENMGAPSFLAVVTATEFAYTREDGVHVIPLGCLRD